MTPPDVWTSEAPTNNGPYRIIDREGVMQLTVAFERITRADGRPDFYVLRYGAAIADLWSLLSERGWKRSAYAIPSAERLAAMERAVEALAEIAKDCWSHVEGCKFKFAPVDECPNPKCGARAIARAALAAVEAAR